ncbi:MAG: DUF6923 family protein [Niabella sp.]
MKRIVILLIVIITFYSSVKSQTLPPPMNCPTDGILVQGSTSEWYHVDLVTGSYTISNDTVNKIINAIGYNVKDNRIYGYLYGNSTGRLTISSFNGTSWTTVVTTNPVARLPVAGYIVGDVDTSGYLYLTRGSVPMYKVDVNPARTSTYLTCVDTVDLKENGNIVYPSIADWSFNPKDGYLYGVTGLRDLIRVNKTTGVVTNLGPSGIPSTETDNYGATYFDSDGFLYASNNTSGHIYRLDLRTGTFDATNTALFANGPAATQNDGARCPLAALPLDFGDAPSTYGTTLGANGARHFIKVYTGTSSSLYLGPTVVSETDGIPSSTANSYTDEDGVSSVSPMPNSSVIGSQVIPAYSITTSFTNTTGSTAYFAAWLDWNNNGVFDAGEGLTRSSSSIAGNITFTWNNKTLSGPTGTISTFVRIRVSTKAITTADMVGPLPDGEVEDYVIPLSFALPATITDFSAWIQNNQLAVSWATLMENNNSLFEIWYSTDGNQFNKLGIVNSKALNGNSNNRIQYTFDTVMSFQQSMTGAGLVIIALLLIGSVVYRKKTANRITVTVAAALTIGLVAIVGCMKATEITNADGEKGKVFVKIVQIDKDGTKIESKIIKAIVK